MKVYVEDSRVVFDEDVLSNDDDELDLLLVLNLQQETVTYL